MKTFRALTLAGLLFTAVTVVQGGGPIEVCDPAAGTPYTWQVPAPGPPAAFYNVESGPLNSGITNAAAAATVTAAFGVWEAVPTASITYAAGPGLVDLGVFDPAPGNACTGLGTPIDVDETNIFCVFGVADGQSPVVFDDDGSLFAFLGLPPGVLGFASVDILVGPPTCAVTEGFAAIGGSSVMPDGPGSLLLLDDVLVHEFGHFSGLGHSVVNGEARGAGDETGPTPTDFFGFPPDGFTETMYPFAGVEPEGEVASPEADDITILSTLYPDAGFPGAFATITGTVLDSDGITGLTGVNIIARNTADPFADAVSAISGDFTQGGGPLGLNDGSYTLNGLTPGADYVVYIDEILGGGFSTPLLADPLGPGPVVGPFPGPEETFNGPSESADAAIDTPGDLFPFPVAAGVNPGIDIIINGTGGAGGCGDGAVTAPETCDPPGAPAGQPDECRIDCTFCGDGNLDLGLELIGNGDFETGTLAGWTVDDLLGSSGTFITSTPGAAMPTSGNPTSPNPGGGAFYAVTDQSGPGTHALSQAFTVPAGATQVLLSFEMFVDDWNGFGPIIDPIGLDHTGPPNQHSRVDILSAGSPPFDTGAGVVANFYLGVDPLAPPNPYTSYLFDITGFVAPGSTFILRFAEVDNQLFQHQGVDNVSIVAFPLEECDDGNNVNNDGCDENCVVEAFFCGDGLIIAPETCDPPGLPAGQPDECRGDCTFCGDGLLDPGEACDDGNNANGDGCSATCVVETFSQGDLLGSTGAQGATLIDIDRTTGAGTFRAPHGAFGNVTEIEFRSDGLLIGATGGGAGALVEIDPSTGVETLRCSHTFGAINGLEYVGGTLYGSFIPGPGGQPSTLVIVGDPVAGVCSLTTVGPTGFNNLGGLAYDAGTDTLYGCGSGGVSGGDLVTCNRVTGACTLVGPTGVDQCSALEFSQDGVLYAGVGGSSSAAGDLFTIDPATGAGTGVGPTGFPVLSGLAFAPGGDDDFTVATPIGCGFSGSLDIDPLGDTDYFLLTGPPGFDVAIDIDADQAGSTLDSLLGVFDITTAFIAGSDDTPAPGEPFTLDSFLQVVMPGAGQVFVVVSSFADVDFTGGADASTTGPYSISVTCSPPALCGDGAVVAPETCDPPGVPAGQPDECRADCTFCGDGLLDPGEACDDGNNANGDGCSATCVVETFSQGDLLGSTGGQGATLIDIDRTTGAGTFRAPHGAFGNVTEIEFRSDGLLMGATGGGASSLIEIDPVTGAESLRCTHAFGALQGLEYVGGTLYGTLFPAGDLVIVGDPVAGVCPLTTVGLTGVGKIGGLAYDAGTDTLYGCGSGGVSGGDLVTCNRTTGACTLVGPTGFTECSALEFSPDGILYGGLGGQDAATGTLITIDPATGAGTGVGPTGFPVLSGLAFVPGPDDDFTTATPISCPSFGATLAIDPLGDTDYFLLTGPPGAGVTIDIDASQTGSTLDPMLGVFNLGLALTDFSDDDPAPGEPFTLDSFLQVTLPAAGQMFIAVSSFADVGFNGGADAFTTGPYMISVACGDLPPGDLLGSTGGSGATLIDIDEASGAGVARAPHGAFGNVTEIEFRADGLLIGATGGGASTLIEIDPVTGLESFRCSHTFGAINGLEYVGGTLYGSFVPGGGGGQPSTLVIVGNPVAGVCSLTTVGPTGFNNLGGLAYDAGAGILYGCTSGGLSGGDLVACNLATGACTLVGSTGFDECSALEFASHGALYGGIGGQDAAAGDLIRIDPDSGAAVGVGPTGFPVLSGLAFVPFPDDPDGDGIIDAKDNCPLTPNPGGGTASFAGRIEATLSNTFAWTIPQDVDWVRGDLGGVSGYLVLGLGGGVPAATAILAPQMPFALGDGLFWLVRPDCPLTTWDSGGSGECPPAGGGPSPPCPPGGRDGNLPSP